MRHRTRQRLVRALVGAAALVALTALIFVSGCYCVPKHPYLSALVLLDVAAQDAPSRLKRSTPAPGVTAIEYTVAGRAYRADVYRSGEATEAGILLVPGAAELGKDDPRLVAFARTLARVKFAVLVPDLPAFRKLELGAENITEIADAMAYLSSRGDLAPAGRAGAAAFSYAVGPVILAALEPHLQDSVRFIVGVGGYHDLERVVRFFTTGFFRDHTKENSPWQHLDPNEYGKWVFVFSNTDRLASPTDRDLMNAIAKRKLEEPAASVESLAARLGPEGGRYYRLITNTDPALVPELIAQLPADIKAEFNVLNPARHDLSKLNARLLLFHGRDDDIIPYTESIALAQAVPRGQSELFIVNGVMHVDVGQIGWWHQLPLWCGIDALLKERTRK